MNTSMNLSPKVSIVIPIFNRCHTIANTIRSIQNQTFSDLEIIAVDDGSTDGTIEVLRDFGSTIKLVSQPNAGPSAARNHGARLSRGEILMFQDSDDTWLPTKVADQYNQLAAVSPTIPCSITNASIFGTNGAPSRTSFDAAGIKVRCRSAVWANPRAFFLERFVLFNQVLAVRREAFMHLGGYNERLRILEDWELAFRLSRGSEWLIHSGCYTHKFNDTHGIGVEVMQDRHKHILHQRAAIREAISTAQPALPPSEIAVLSRRLRRLESEERMLTSAVGTRNPAKRAQHTLLRFAHKVRKSIRRRFLTPSCEFRPLVLSSVAG